MAATPFLGSRISLISRSDIRYEGILVHIDPNESTVYLSNGSSTCSYSGICWVALASAPVSYEFLLLHPSDIPPRYNHVFAYLLGSNFLVRSYGTEDRQTEKVVPPSAETYEYIIFRSSDIKDLTVSEAPAAPQPQAPRTPNDPAIVQQVRVAFFCPFLLNPSLTCSNKLPSMHVFHMCIFIFFWSNSVAPIV
jgi:protein LSM14